MIGRLVIPSFISPLFWAGRSHGLCCLTTTKWLLTHYRLRKGGDLLFLLVKFGSADNQAEQGSYCASYYPPTASTGSTIKLMGSGPPTSLFRPMGSSVYRKICHLLSSTTLKIPLVLPSLLVLGACSWWRKGTSSSRSDCIWAESGTGIWRQDRRQQQEKKLQNTCCWLEKLVGGPITSSFYAGHAALLSFPSTMRCSPFLWARIHCLFISDNGQLGIFANIFLLHNRTMSFYYVSGDFDIEKANDRRHPAIFRSLNLFWAINVDRVRNLPSSSLDRLLEKHIWIDH